MSTFAEIAQRALARGDWAVATLGMIADLAEAMERLEYNTAAQLAFKGVHGPLQSDPLRRLIGSYLQLLRGDIPEGGDG